MYMKITRLNTKFSLQHTPVLPNGGKLQTITDNNKFKNIMDENMLKRYEKRINRVKYLKGSYMNNTKWKKLFTTICKNSIVYCPCEVRVKLLGEDNNLFRISLYLENEEYTRDDISGPPTRLSDIEYLVMTLQSKDEMFRLEKLINELGKYEYQLDDETYTIKIYGYK
ncbi:hypothetical protein BFAG_01583 [Bacteroides fragilis 3_1_12]|nr:hypothetical protein BFAG_01583 [Bacteroides fragilis 3_1_12]